MDKDEMEYSPSIPAVVTIKVGDHTREIAISLTPRIVHRVTSQIAATLYDLYEKET
jgi:hypothetical protein